MSKIIAVEWWATKPMVGLVVIELEPNPEYPKGALKGYIGSPPLSGFDERTDSQWIAAHGVRVHNLAMLKAVFPHLVDQDWYVG